MKWNIVIHDNGLLFYMFSVQVIVKLSDTNVTRYKNMKSFYLSNVQVIVKSLDNDESRHEFVSDNNYNVFFKVKESMSLSSVVK